MHKRFHVSGRVVGVIKSLDLDVAEGKLFVIACASGSGKTTLPRCIAELESLDGGEICIDGKIVSSENPPAWISSQLRKLGMVFQSYAVWPHLSVAANIALPLAAGFQKIPPKDVAARVKEALHLVQLDEQADQPATFLSGGRQQHVALARAIAGSSRWAHCRSRDRPRLAKKCYSAFAPSVFISPTALMSPIPFPVRLSQAPFSATSSSFALTLAARRSLARTAPFRNGRAQSLAIGYHGVSAA